MYAEWRVDWNKKNSNISWAKIHIGGQEYWDSNDQQEYLAKYHTEFVWTMVNSRQM